jgi:hypothetical protein
MRWRREEEPPVVTEPNKKINNMQLKQVVGIVLDGKEDIKKNKKGDMNVLWRVCLLVVINRDNFVLRAVRPFVRCAHIGRVTFDGSTPVLW